MKLGVLTVPLGDQPLDDALASLADLGVDCVELGSGGFPGDDHLDRTALLDDREAQQEFLDTTAYTEEADRSWLFRSIGYGHSESHWKDIVSTLRMVGYEGALSIEHEDSLTSATEGLEKAIDVLSRAMFETEPGEAYWAE